MEDPDKRVLEFDSFRIDLNNRLLLKNAEVVALAPKTFDLLAVLVENHGAVLDKETLIRKVWPDVFVEESNLTKNVSLLRKSLGDGPDGRAYIETLPRRGYRFRACALAPDDIIVEEETSTEVVIESETSTTRFPRAKLFWIGGLVTSTVLLLVWIIGWNSLRSIPIRSIAVLPFRALDGSEHLGDGITEELTIRLSRVRSLRVISPQVAMRFKNIVEDPSDIGRQLASDAVLVGAVRTGGGRIRVTAQLLFVRDGSVIWADGLDERLEDSLRSARRMASSLVEQLQFRLTPGEHSAVERLATKNGQAYESLLRGKSQLAASRSAGRRYNDNGTVEFFRRAVLLDPSYPDAYSWLAASLSGSWESAETHQAAVAYAQKPWISIQTRSLPGVPSSSSLSRSEIVALVWHTQSGCSRLRRAVGSGAEIGRSVSQTSDPFSHVCTTWSGYGHSREPAARACVQFGPSVDAILWAEVEALLRNRGAALSYLRQAVNRDWLQFQFFDYYQRPQHRSFHFLRNEPEYRALRNQVVQRVEELRKLF